MIGQLLSEILQNDNTIRKSAEDKLNAAKSQDPDRYACYLVSVLSPECNFTIDVKSLAAVILRRNISI
jgi:importin-5